MFNNPKKLIVVLATAIVVVPLLAQGADFALINKEYILDPIIKALANKFLGTASDNILRTVREGGIGGFESLVIQDWRSFILGGEERGYKNFAYELQGALQGINISGLNPRKICPDLQTPLAKIFGNADIGGGSLNHDNVQKWFSATNGKRKVDIGQFVSQVGCSRSNVKDKSLDTIYQELGRGQGWDEFDKLFRPENTTGGLIILGLNELEKQKDIEKQAAQAEAQVGNGFQSKREKGKGCTFSVLDQDLTGINETACLIKDKIKVPGSIYNQETANTVNKSLELLVSADEIGEITNVFASLLINKMLDLGKGLVSSNSIKDPDNEGLGLGCEPVDGKVPEGCETRPLDTPPTFSPSCRLVPDPAERGSSIISCAPTPSLNVVPGSVIPGE